MRICFLGTGGSWPTKRRNPMSISVSSKQTNILLDCGEGTQKQILSTSISPIKLNAILITHLHGDHFLGVMGLIQTMSLNDRTDGLDIYGPKGIREAYEKGSTMCHNSLNFPVRVTELEPGREFRIGSLNVRVGKADHKIPALAFRIFEDDRPGRFNKARAIELGIPKGRSWSKLQSGEDIILDNGLERRTITPDMILGPRRRGKSIAYSGDTYSDEEMVDISKDVDILIHEATFSNTLSEKADQYRHSTPKMAAECAKKAGAGKLYLVHSSPRYSREGEDKILLEEAKSIFPESYMPEDLETVEVTR